MSTDATPGPIEWTGDLDDDCTARWGDMRAQAENMGRYDDDDTWFCCVSGTSPAGNPRIFRSIFHSADADILPLSGRGARLLAELAMKAAAWDALQGMGAGGKAD